ncbi:MAG TPA: histidine--tRNA ligase [Myxococcota bacterium]|nr:histidine--tRNA ligase [Myxococcota bacterium]
MSLQPPRGTRDFYPEAMRLRHWLFGHFREVARGFGYEEVDAPVLEHAELFIRKAGEEIVDQLYHFTLHDRHLALRPELTPSLARMVIARQGELALPLRWYSIPQCWRYERMTRGRRREHYQWNMDVWGVPGVEAEAELIAAAFALLDRLGLPRGDVRVRVSSRGLLEALARGGELGAERFAALCVIVDKLGKLGRDAVAAALTDPAGPVRLAAAESDALLGFLAVRDLADARRRLPASAAPALAELDALFGALDAYGVADRVDFDASIVRGLAYYTGVVFEAFDAAGKLRAICGGGRYDRLVESLGGRPLPAAGFGFGDAVIGELLAEKGLLPDLPRGLDDVVVAVAAGADAEPVRRAAIRHATRLREAGRAVELALDLPLKRALGRADRAGAARAHLIGPDELARGVARVRELASGSERDEPLGGS